MRRRYLSVFGLALLAGCSDSRVLPAPTSPTLVIPGAASGPCPPCPPPGVYALSGVVRAAGVPVAGATVGLVRIGPQNVVSYGPEEFVASVVTDGAGSYHFPQVANVSFSGALVSASKGTYFTETKYVLMSQDRRQEFDLEPSQSIALGGVTVSPLGQSSCASFGYGGQGGSQCRRFALPVPAAGTLMVSVSSSPSMPFDISVLRPDGTIGVNASASSSPLHVALSVTPGIYQIDVVHIDPRADRFELTTTLR
jgi:hypothetical protein